MFTGWRLLRVAVWPFPDEDGLASGQFPPGLEPSCLLGNAAPRPRAR